MSNNLIRKPISRRAHALEASLIREVAEVGMTMDDVVPLWFGEGAWPTSPQIVEAAIASLQAGRHNYQPNNGTVGLRDAICSYSNNLYGCELTRSQVTVTPSGMQGLMLAAEMLVTPEDRVVAIEPSWPNIIGAFKAMGADVVTQNLRPVDGRWALDLDALIDALTPDTTVFVVNSPNNPTGWTMSTQEQKTVLDHCRKHGIWIVSDDVYTRLYRHGTAAPSFLSIATAEDRLLSVNSFSKCWSMTGWRLGWVVAPPELEAKFGQLTEFNTSCTTSFVQDAGIVALQKCEGEIAELNTKIRRGFEITSYHLKRFSRVNFIEPDGAFYCFFQVDGLDNSYDAALQIMREAKVGLAPGIAFGGPGEGYLRLCYAQPEEVLHQAFDQLSTYLS
ncbi:pyridoxal phosphate-dependent aminotransferase [Polycladidibacter hongkongensis]|uniref:pyridoxal phosphate-dependent aminotransferase n=1 Tax=Polycladidibacter hongkongensis TaxID=1647556 RepID=UPI000831B70B|nr:pyridoxal phosphate-dependent aminotransferase [Pseudovibrio hongkongensis]